VVVRGEAVDRTFVALTEQNTMDINLTMNDSSFTSGRSAGGGVGGELGGSSVGADGSSTSAGVSGGRTGGTALSTTATKVTGHEGLLVETGSQLQFLERYKMVADIVDADGTVIQTVPLEDTKVQVSTPERRALRLYGRRELDLPLSVATDAAERFLNGKLKISPRDASAFIRRYKEEKAGVTTGLAAEHTDEVLAKRVIEHARGAEPTAVTTEAQLDDVLASVEQTTGQQVAMSVPPQYDLTLASAKVQDISPIDRPGAHLDLLNPVLRQVEELAPGLLDSNPLLRASLATNLRNDSFHGHLRDMFGVRGFVAEVEVPVPGQPQPDLIVVRVRSGFDGPVLVDGKADIPAASPDGAVGEVSPDLAEDAGSPDLPEVAAIGLDQNYRIESQSQSFTHSTTISAGAEVKAAGDTSLSAGVGTDRARSVTARAGNANAHLDRTGHFEMTEVVRDAAFDVQAARVHAAGAAVTSGLRWRLNKTLPADQTVYATPERVRARMTLVMPKDLLKPKPPAGPEKSAESAAAVVPVEQDHRTFRVPEDATAEAMVPYGKGQPPTDQLHQQIRDYQGHGRSGAARARGDAGTRSRPDGAAELDQAADR
jgi:hypothetical protein